LLRICNFLFFAAAAIAAGNGPELASPSQHYSLKLNPLLSPQTPAQGLFVKARINGGPALRMLLDSGAGFIVLSGRAGARLGRQTGVAMDLVGVGAKSRAAKQVAPGTVEIGDLILSRCEMVVAPGELLDGVDGVIPLSLFAGFLVRLDVPGKMLELDPLPARPPAGDEGYAPARTERGMVFLEGSVDGSQPGYVLLDTGASFNAVSTETASNRAGQRFGFRRLSLTGGSGETEGFMLPAGVRFRFGSQVMSADPVVVVDLSNLAGHHRFPIAGVLGYPALRRSVVTVDYRDGLVRLAGK
jgi:predicted aspartyl protease